MESSRAVFANLDVWLDKSLPESIALRDEIESHEGTLVESMAHATWAVIDPELCYPEVLDQVKATSAHVITPAFVRECIHTGGPPPGSEAYFVRPPTDTIESKPISNDAFDDQSVIGHLADRPTDSSRQSSLPNEDDNDGDYDELEGGEFTGSISRSGSQLSANKKRYSEEEKVAIRTHWDEHHAKYPRDSKTSVWNAYAAKHPGRSVTALMQWHDNDGKRGQDITGQHLNEPRPIVLPSPTTSSRATQKGRVRSDGAPAPPAVPWTAEDDQMVVDFIRRKNFEHKKSEWREIKTTRRSPNSLHMKYVKHRAYFDSLAGRPPLPLSTSTAFTTTDITYPSLPPIAPFAPTLPDAKAPPLIKRKAVFGSVQNWEDSDGEENDEEYMEGEGIEHVSIANPQWRPRNGASGSPYRSPPNVDRFDSTIGPSTAGPSSSVGTLSAATQNRASPKSPNYDTSYQNGFYGPSTSSWPPIISTAEHGTALVWAMTRSPPENLLDDMKSWVEFAHQHPEHTEEEWLCAYMLHLPTYKAVAMDLGTHR